MITREQVQDLRPGDVVELTSADWPEGTVVRGPLWMLDGETLQVASSVIRHWDGRHPYNESLHLTVISRAPRPLYVNHDRTEPRRGDVVRFDPDGEPEDWDNVTWFFNGKEWRQLSNGSAAPIYGEMPCGLRLLVDGETGQVVP